MMKSSGKMVGVTGFEPVTLRLSSACSNQLSYTPAGIVGLPDRGALAPAPRRREAGGAEEIRTPDL